MNLTLLCTFSWFSPTQCYFWPALNHHHHHNLCVCLCVNERLKQLLPFHWAENYHRSDQYYTLCAFGEQSKSKRYKFRYKTENRKKLEHPKHIFFTLYCGILIDTFTHNQNECLEIKIHCHMHIDYVAFLVNGILKPI